MVTEHIESPRGAQFQGHPLHPKLDLLSRYQASHDRFGIDTQ